MDKPDMTGMSLKKNELWEKRVKELCLPNYFNCMVGMDTDLVSQLTDDEIQRMTPKMHLVQEFAKAMAAGMLKGTIKYPTDDWGTNWVSNMLGEQADAINYMLLTMSDLANRGKV